MAEQFEFACSVAIFGTSGMVREHAKAFSAVPGTTIVDIHSRTRTCAQALAAELGIPAVYDSVDELHRETGADLGGGAVPELARNGVAKACFRFACALLLEKLTDYTLADAQDIAAATENTGARVRVGLNCRFVSSSQAVLRDLADDPGPRVIHVRDQQSLETARAHHDPEEFAADWMFVNSIHVIIYLTMLGRGSILEIALTARWEPPAPSAVLATARFASGDIDFYSGIWNGPAPRASSVTKRQRRWSLRPLEKGGVPERWRTQAQFNRARSPECRVQVRFPLAG